MRARSGWERFAGERGAWVSAVMQPPCNSRRRSIQKKRRVKAIRPLYSWICVLKVGDVCKNLGAQVLLTDLGFNGF